MEISQIHGGDRSETVIYNSEGYLDSDIAYYWDHLEEKWVPKRYHCAPPCFGGRKVFSYDLHGNIIEQVIYTWSEGSNAWVIGCEQGPMTCSRRYIYLYDDYGNLSTITAFTWKRMEAVWGKEK